MGYRTTTDFCLASVLNAPDANSVCFAETLGFESESRRKLGAASVGHLSLHATLAVSDNQKKT
jgi:hypothetical protein